MKKLLFLLVYFAFTQISFSTEPAAIVPALPSNLDTYTDSEEMYFDKLMEYYVPALILETQLKLMNVTPKLKVPVVNSTMISNMDPKYFKQYNKIAFELYSQIKDLPFDVINKQLYDSEKENKELKKDVTKLSIDTVGTAKYRELYQMLLEAIDKNLADNKEIEARYVEKIRKLLNEISEVKYNLTPVEEAHTNYALTVEPIVEQFYYDNNQVSSGIAPGAIASLNLLRIAKNVGVINLWGKYSYISTQSEVRSPLSSTSEYLNYKNDMWAFGGDFELSISELLQTNSLYWSFKIGFGYMKGFIRTPNTSLPDKDYHGNMIKIETDFFNINRIFPFGIVLGVNFNKYSTDLTYPAFQRVINLGTPWVPSVYFGLNFNLLKIY